MKWTGLKVKESPRNKSLKVVNNYYATVCECLPTDFYAGNYKTTVNEMVHAWNESFGKGLDIKTGLAPLRFSNDLRSDKHVFIADAKEFNSFEEVERYAHSKGQRVQLTQTAIDSNIYLVILTK